MIHDKIKPLPLDSYIMPTRRQLRKSLTLLTLLPFLLIAFIPQGMMLSPNSGSFSKTLVVCTSNGLRTIRLSEAMGVIDESPSDSKENSCPYSLANAAYIDTSGIIRLPEPALVHPTRLARYRAKYLLNLYPARLPRGPPIAI